MKGRTGVVPDPERRRAANAALTDSIEEVCRHYAPSGAHVDGCWEVRSAGDRHSLRVFLTGPMQGSWTDAATGARGDALDLVARLGGLDAAGSLAEAERFLGRNAAGSERKSGDAGGGQMALFGTLPESGGRKRPARRSGNGRKAGASRRAATTHEPPADAASSRPGGEPQIPADETAPSRIAADAPAPEDGMAEPGPADPAQDSGTGADESGRPATAPDGAGFTAEDRQLLRRSAEDAAWTRSRLTVRERDAEAHTRVRMRRQKPARRWRRAVVEAVGLVVVAAVWLAVGVSTEHRYGVADLLAAYGFELARDTAVLPDGNGG